MGGGVRDSVDLGDGMLWSVIGEDGGGELESCSGCFVEV